MNPMRRWRRYVAVGMAAALSMTVASPSWASELPDGQSQKHAHDAVAPARPLGDEMTKRHEEMARGAAMDDRINALVADMNMFTGELKMVAMAALLTAIVERQSIMRDEMMRTRDGTLARGTTGDTVSSVPSQVDPDTMCVAEAP